MKKLIATFLFAVGAGISFTAGATSCDYMCSVSYRLCMKQATGDTEAEIACYDALDQCLQSCSW